MSSERSCTYCREAFGKFVQIVLGRLPVMRGKHAVGFISMRDLMTFELDQKTDELNHLHHYMHGSA